MKIRLIIFSIVSFFFMSPLAHASDLIPGLVSYYAFSSSTPVDSLGLNNGTDFNTSYGPGIIGNAVDYNGTSAYTVIGTGLNSTLVGTSWSISFWVNPSSLSNGYILGVDNSSGDRQFQIFYIAGGALEFDREGSGVCTTGTNMQENVWQHYVITYGSGVATVYRNGSVDCTNSMSVFNSSANNLQFGARQYPGSPVYYNGYLDEVGFWNVTLDSSQISELYNSGMGVTYPFGTPPPPPFVPVVPNYYEASTTCITVGSSTPAGLGYTNTATTTCDGFVPLFGGSTSTAPYINSSTSTPIYIQSDTTYGDFAQWFMWIIFMMSIPTWRYFFSLWRKRGPYDKL